MSRLKPTGLMEVDQMNACRGIAARIWCDRDFQHMVMDVDLCEEIAQKLFQSIQQDEPEPVIVDKA